MTDEPPVVLLLVEWPAHPEQAATLLVRLDHGDQRYVPLLSQWCAGRASVSPVRRGDGRIELRRRPRMDQVHGFLIAEDSQPPPPAGAAGARPALRTGVGVRRTGRD